LVHEETRYQAIRRREDLLFACAESRLEILTAELVPTILGAVTLPSPAYDLAVEGSYAVTTAGGAGIHFIDISSVENPMIVGSLSTSAFSVAVSGSFAFLTSSQYLRVVDFSDPTNPTIIATVTGLGWAQGITVQGNYAFVAGNSFRVFDISNPSQPSIVASIPGFYSYSNDISIDASLAYVVDGAKLVVIDVRNPEEPIQLDSFYFPGSAASVAASQGYAYLAGTQLTVINAQDPYDLRIEGGQGFPGYGSCIAIDQDHLYIGDDYGGLRTLSAQCAPQAVEAPMANSNHTGTLEIQMISPNPSSAFAQIRFVLHEKSDVQLCIYNASGRRVKELLHQEKEAGEHSVLWDGNDMNGLETSSGVYIVGLRSGPIEVGKRFVHLK
jgi:hypothetical protein